MPGPDNLPPTLRSASGDAAVPSDPKLTERLDRVRDDQQRRWRNGERVPVETYVRQEPKLFADARALLELIVAEADLREELGEQPRCEEYTQRFPEHAREIQLLFEFDQALRGDPNEVESETQLRGPAAETSASGPATPAPGSPVPGFEILAELGRGGMGVVYKARHLRLGRVVALKMILTGPHAAPDEVVRFLAEAEAVARMHHPNIVPLFESGYHNGMPWFTLEYVPGGSLAKRLNGVPLPPEEAGQLVEQLADGVQHAHDEGILHRDLKPANVLLDSDGTPKITDFGLAKRVEVGSGLTMTGTVMGTPSYMAPEQAAGGAKHVGPAADVYALGAILYECLTGRPPFQGPSAMDVVRQVLIDEPVPPRLLVHAVPRDLETICLKCLRKDPSKRYGSAAALQEDLRRFRERQPILARPVGFVERSAMWARRRPTAAALLAVAVLGLFVLVGLIWAGNRQLYLNERRTRAAGLVRSLADAETAAVPRIVEDLNGYRALANPLLEEMLHKASPDSPREVHALLALLPADPRRAEALADYVPRCRPQEVRVLRDALLPYDTVVAERLWPVLRDPDESASRRLRAACALAAMFPDDPSWNQVAPAVANALAAENSLTLVHWAEALYPARARLLPALTKLYQATRQKLTEQGLELSALVEQASRLERIADLMARGTTDQPATLAALLPDLDPRHYARLVPHLKANAHELTAAMRRELQGPEASAENKPPLPVLREIELTHGLVAPHFAFCQTLPLEQFDQVRALLARHGYRPERLRPFATSDPAGEQVLVAAIWKRDGRPTEVLHGATATEIEQAHTRHRGTGLRPVDVAGYRVGNEVRYAAVWVQLLEQEPDRELNVGQTESQLGGQILALRTKGFRIPLTYSFVTGAAGELRVSGVWGKPDPSSLHEGDRYGLNQSQVDEGLALDRILHDICVYPAAPAPSRLEVLEAMRARAVTMLKEDQGNAEALVRQARAAFHLGRDQEVLDALETLLGMFTQHAAEGYYLRARIHARQGRAEAARADLAEFKDRSLKPVAKQAAAAVVAGSLGGEEPELQRLEEWVQTHFAEDEVLYEAGRAYALVGEAVRQQQAPRAQTLAVLSGLFSPLPWAAAQTLVRQDGIRQEYEMRAARYTDRALALLESAVAHGYTRFANLRDDDDLTSLRPREEFRKLVARGHLDRLYAVIWGLRSDQDSQTLYGLEPQAVDARARELVAQGYRPVSLSVVQTQPGKPLASASVWHRPTLAAEARDARARRKAGAAATLLHLHEPGPVWPLFRESADPGARSYLVHRASALGVDPSVLLDRFQTEANVSARRALLLTLGEYTPENLPPSSRAALTDRLLKLFTEEPDPGLHAAIDWLLRQRWGKASRIASLENELRGKPTTGRGWYLNSQGQTFSVVKGPVEFTMGSPGSEPNRGIDETPHRRRIPRSFAISVRPVTVEEFERFLTEHPEIRTDTHNQRFTPKPNCPVVNVTWFEAAAYCRWLSEQEQIPPAQMCYPEIAKIREGVSLFPDCLTRTGYRLPTEAEWEYACRSGSETSRYYGDSEELLEQYAWYVKNSRERTWPVGMLKPNDLGLFDMHGNVWNWTQDPAFRLSLPAWGRPIEDRYEPLPVTGRTPRVLRGGAFDVGPAFLRCAVRYPELPSRTSSTIGFRVARTWPMEASPD